MRKSKLTTLLVFVLLASANAFSQKRPATSAAPKFSSVYTDFKKDCRYEQDAASRARGQDPVFLCKPVAGFRVMVGYSAQSSIIGIKNEAADHIKSITMQHLNYNDAPGRKVEWRLADGKPFAVILRVSNFGDEYAGTDQYFDDKNKTGESLLVRGLTGFEHINFDVDVKTTPNPNVKARELADSNYRKK